VERQSLRVTVFDVEMRAQCCRVAYDKQRHTIVTFLPKDAGGEEPTPITDDSDNKKHVEKAS
jgi:hypothetical protein